MARSPAMRLPFTATDARSDRMLALLVALNDRGSADLGALAVELGVTASTLRRDVAVMADQGLLVRTRGGVRAMPAGRELPVQLHELQAREAKRRIAVRAAELVPPGARVVALSGGTTTAETARALARRPGLTIVTNALAIAVELAASPAADVVAVGGQVRSASLEAVGPLAEQTWRAMTLELAIVGVDGISATAGATTHDEVEAHAAAGMLARAERVVVVADRSKIGRATPARMTAIDRVDVLVTDDGADPAELERLRRAGVEVHAVRTPLH